MSGSEPQPVDPQQVRRAVRRGLISVLGLCIAGVAALIAISKTDLGTAAILDLQDRMNIPTLLLATGLMSLAFIAMALRWRALMPPSTRPPIGGLTLIILAGLLLNYAVPGPFGELGAAFFAHRRYRLAVPDALASGVAARLVGLATAAILAGVLWLSADLPIPAGYDAVVGAAAGIAGLGGVVLCFMAMRPEWAQRVTSRFAMRAPDVGPLHRVASKISAGVASLAASLAKVARRGPTAWLAAAGWSLVGHGCVTAGIIAAVIGLGAPLSVTGLAFTYATTTAGAVALFALPGSQLGWDALFSALLVGSAGLAVPDAVAVAVLVRLQQVTFMVVGAVAVTWLLREHSHTNAGPPEGNELETQQM